MPAAKLHRIPKGKSTGGRPPYAPTKEQRAQVKDLAFVGIDHDRIARVMGIDSDTLKKHFRAELEMAIDETLGKVGRNMIALSETAPLAGIYILNNRLPKLWQDRRNVKLEVDDRRPDFSNATPEQLEILAEAAQVMRALREGPKVIEHQPEDDDAPHQSSE